MKLVIVNIYVCIYLAREGEGQSERVSGRAQCLPNWIKSNAKQKNNENKIIHCPSKVKERLWPDPVLLWNIERQHTYNISGSLVMMMMIDAMIVMKTSFILFIVTDCVKIASYIHKTIITWQYVARKHRLGNARYSYIQSHYFCIDNNFMFYIWICACVRVRMCLWFIFGSVGT